MTSNHTHHSSHTVLDLTIELMRVDVANMLHEAPSEILDDDNLMEWGLDSMRAMTLAAKWRQAGAHIEFADMATEPTLAHWWNVINRNHA